MNLRVQSLAGTSRWLAAAVVLMAGVHAAAAPLSDPTVAGQILGNVRSARGVAQMGARVFLYNRYEEIVSRSLTDEAGRFAFAGLLPDVYSIRVLLASFVPAERKNISVLPSTENRLDINLTSVLSTVQLMSSPISTGTLMSDDWKWVLRASQSTRPVLRMLPEWGGAASSTNTASVGHRESAFSHTSGVVRVSAGDGQSLAAGSEQSLGTAFALATSLAGSSSKLQLSGNVGYGGMVSTGPGAASLRTSYTPGAAGLSQPELVVTMRQLYMMPREGSGIALGSANAPPLRTMSAALIDKASIGELVTLDYGFDFQSISYIDRLNYMSPFMRATVDFGDQGRIRAAYTSGSRPNELLLRDAHRQGDLDMNFAALAQLPSLSLSDGHVAIERTQNMELGYERPDGSRTYSVAAYREIVSNGAFMLSAPNEFMAVDDLLPDLTSRSSIFNVGSYQRLGYMASVKQSLGDKAEISIAGGRTGGFLSPENNATSYADGGDLRAGIRQVQRPWITVRAAATLPIIGTRVSASYGWTDFQVLVPVHVFVTGSSRQDVGVNVFLRQPLPAISGMPCRIEATVDVRNAMAQGYLPLGGRSVLTNSPRAMRAGFNFIF